MCSPSTRSVPYPGLCATDNVLPRLDTVRQNALESGMKAAESGDSWSPRAQPLPSALEQPLR